MRRFCVLETYGSAAPCVPRRRPAHADSYRGFEILRRGATALLRIAVMGSCRGRRRMPVFASVCGGLWPWASGQCPPHSDESQRWDGPEAVAGPRSLAPQSQRVGLGDASGALRRIAVMGMGRDRRRTQGLPPGYAKTHPATFDYSMLCQVVLMVLLMVESIPSMFCLLLQAL
jgi:hypothetical protein